MECSIDTLRYDTIYTDSCHVYCNLLSRPAPFFGRFQHFYQDLHSPQSDQITPSLMKIQLIS